MKPFEAQDSPYPREADKRFKPQSISGLPFPVRIGVTLFDMAMLIGFLPALLMLPDQFRRIPLAEPSVVKTFLFLGLVVYPIIFSARMARKRWGYGMARWIALAVSAYILLPEHWMFLLTTQWFDHLFPITVIGSLLSCSVLSALSYHIVYKNSAPDPE